MDPSTLAQYGALGVLALSAVSVAAALWRRLLTQQDAHTKKLDDVHAGHAKQLEEIGELHTKRLETLLTDHKAELRVLATEHKAEMKLLMERLIETHSIQMREYHKLSENMVNVLDSMTRKFERPRGRPA